MRADEENFVPFRVTADLQQGVVLDSRFGVGLDSLLASEIRSREKSARNLSGSELDGGTHQENVSVVRLPLGRCGKQEPDWHWLCTTAYPLSYDGTPVFDTVPEVHSLIQVIDTPTLEKASQKLPTVVSAKAGRWRSKKIPVPVTLAHRLAWQGYGDVEAIRSLLENIDSIGQRRGIGEGTIVRWQVEAVPEASAFDAGHLHEDGTLGRPTPRRCLENYITPIDSITYTRAGLRPPYWHHGNQYEVAIKSNR